MHGSQTGFPRLGAADLRTLAKARQNRMWKIEFTKQLSTELIYILHRRERETERESQREEERDHGGSLRGHGINQVWSCGCRGTAFSLAFLELSVYASVHFVICMSHILRVALHTLCAPVL